MNLLMKFALARLKIIMAGVVLAAVAAALTGIEQQFGFPIPNELKLAISTFIGGIVGNYTDNVSLVSEGIAVVRPTLTPLPGPRKVVSLPADEDEEEDTMLVPVKPAPAV